MTANDKGPRVDGDALIARLGPKFTELETMRQAMRIAAFRNAGLVMLAAVALAVLALANLAGEPGTALAVLALIAGLVLAGFMLAGSQKRWRGKARAVLLPAVCEAVDQDLQYRPDVPVDNYLAPFEELKLVGDSNRQQLEHYFFGRHGGRRFEMVDARLASRSGGTNSSTLPVFTGFLIRIEWPGDVDPGITVSPNFGWFSKMFASSSVKTGDAAFDEKFLVSPEKGAEASSEYVLDVLGEDLRRAFLSINEAEGRLAYERAAFHAGFKHDSLYIALSRYQQGSAIGPIKFERPRAFLDVGWVFAPKPALEQGVRGMLDDIGIVYRVIDRL